MKEIKNKILVPRSPGIFKNVKTIINYMILRAITTKTATKTVETSKKYTNSKIANLSDNPVQNSLGKIISPLPPLSMLFWEFTSQKI